VCYLPDLDGEQANIKLTEDLAAANEQLNKEVCLSILQQIIDNGTATILRNQNASLAVDNHRDFVGEFRVLSEDVVKFIGSIEGAVARVALYAFCAQLAQLAAFLGTLDRAGAIPKLQHAAKGARAREGSARNARAEIDRLRPRIVAEILAHPKLSDGKIFNRLKVATIDERKPGIEKPITESDRKRVKAHIAAVRADCTLRRF